MGSSEIRAIMHREHELSGRIISTGRLRASGVCVPKRTVRIARDLVLLALVMTVSSPLAAQSDPPGPPGADNPDGRLHQWGEWRGPWRTGEAPFADPPIEWSETRNVRWKTPIPGLGHSSPIVWGDAVYLTTAIPHGPRLPPVPVTAPGAHDNLEVTRKHQFVVLCVDRGDGRIRWQTIVRDALPHEGGHQTGSLASASPVTDGQRIFAWFGSQGLYALSPEGRVLWSHLPGQMQSKHAHGEGASPALHDGVIVINCDHEGASFVRALDAVSGEELWTRPRDEVTSWASPLILERSQPPQVVVAGTDRIRAYDLYNGEVLWQCGGLSANVVATPVAADGIVIAASSYDTRAMLAIDVAGATGDITQTRHVLWSTRLRTPYVPSPLIVDDSVYFLRHYQGILSRRQLRSGQETGGPWRLPAIRSIYASPVAANGRVYITDLDGQTLVFAHGDNPQPLARNQLDDSFAATPALVDDQLILRGRRHLYSLREER